MTEKTCFFQLTGFLGDVMAEKHTFFRPLTSSLIKQKKKLQGCRADEQAARCHYCASFLSSPSSGELTRDYCVTSYRRKMTDTRAAAVPLSPLRNRSAGSLKSPPGHFLDFIGSETGKGL
jgi:hypothetical protein